MASLNTLPKELLCRVSNFLDRKVDLANCRLVNRRLGEAATRSYFETVPLYADWAPNDPDEPDKDPPWPNNIAYDARMFKNILDSDKIRGLVRRVDIYTCNPDCVS